MDDDTPTRTHPGPREPGKRAPEDALDAVDACIVWPVDLTPARRASTARTSTGRSPAGAVADRRILVSPASGAAPGRRRHA